MSTAGMVNCSLVGSGNSTVINLLNNTIFLEIYGDNSYCKWGNLQINVLTGNTNSIFYIHPDDSQIYFCDFSDIRIYCNAGASNTGWTGFGFALSTAASIMGCNFENITIGDSPVDTGNVGTGFNFACDASLCWMNSNVFRNIWVWKAVIGMDWTSWDISESATFDSNFFYGTMIQPDLGVSVYGLKNVKTNVNIFFGGIVWDWSGVSNPTGTAIMCAATGSAANTFYWGYQPLDQINIGANNYFYNTAQPALNKVTKGRTSVTLTSGAGTITHGLGTTPTWAILTCSTSGDSANITTLGATDLTIKVTKGNNTNGTTQYVNWMCGV